MRVKQTRMEKALHRIKHKVRAQEVGLAALLLSLPIYYIVCSLNTGICETNVQQQEISALAWAWFSPLSSWPSFLFLSVPLR